jgi:three-Cys-motif partner protein
MNLPGPDYEDREQSGIKHYALRLYLEAATRILGPTFNFKYIDCCAGPWKSKAADYSDTSFGIAIDVLNKAAVYLAARNKSTKFACLLIEEKPKSFSKLDSFAKSSDGKNVEIRAENWDFTEHTAEITQYGRTPKTFPFVFIDPKGWTLAGISLITPILQLNPGEVLINLMSSFIARFLMDNKTDFTDLLGEDFPDLRRLTGTDLELAVVEKYCELVKRKGEYKYVCALPVMNPDLDTFNFWLIYATRHRKGVQKFKEAEKRTEKMTHIVRADVQQRTRELRSGNRELFGADVQYQENRYQQLSSENRRRAKTATWELLKVRGTVDYDDCWAEALQMSAVYETDLRGWIAEWEKQGLIEVEGRSSAREVLKINSRHRLRLRRASN